NLGGSTPARRAEPFLAWSQATCICRLNENMSGARRQPTRTEGSIFFAATWAAALARTAARAFTPISKTGRDALYIQTGMELILAKKVNSEARAVPGASGTQHYSSAYCWGKL